MNTKVGNLTLTDSQQKALDRIIAFINNKDERVFILKGYAGTGKTTLVNAIINEINQKQICYVLLASTGRAAKVMSDATRHTTKGHAGKDIETIFPVKTIHSQIYSFKDLNQDMDLFSQPDGRESNELKLRFALTLKEESPVETLYLIDEASMISDSKSKLPSQAEYGVEGRLLKDLLEYDPHGKYIFIGDSCQLPPINQTFSPALSKEYFKSAFNITAEESELTEIMRQTDDNDIVLSATRIRKFFFSPPTGTIAKFPFRGYRHIHLLRNDIEMVKLYLDKIHDRDYSKATLIAMSNKTVSEVSRIIRPALGFSQRISVGDLLMVTQNNMISGLMNGDLVKVHKIGGTEKRAGLSFIHIEVESLANAEVHGQLLIEDILYSGTTNLFQYQQEDLFIDFHKRMKRIGVKQNSLAYRECMLNDPYLNALRCVFGYALTCHKAQGGEWDDVFLMIPRGLPYNDPRRYAYQWVYTAMTRAKKELYAINDYWVI